MALKTSTLYKCLHKKPLVFGFELIDLFVLCLLLAVLNLVFGGMPYKFFFTWVPTLALAVTVRIIKEGKPEGYLKHLLKFWLSSRNYSAFHKSEKALSIALDRRTS